MCVLIITYYVHHWYCALSWRGGLRVSTTPRAVLAGVFILPEGPPKSERPTARDLTKPVPSKTCCLSLTITSLSVFPFLSVTPFVTSIPLFW